jgi:hypothetical protein
VYFAATVFHRLSRQTKLPQRMSLVEYILRPVCIWILEVSVSNKMVEPIHQPGTGILGFIRQKYQNKMWLWTNRYIILGLILIRFTAKNQSCANQFRYHAGTACSRQKNFIIPLWRGGRYFKCHECWNLTGVFVW